MLSVVGKQLDSLEMADQRIISALKKQKRELMAKVQGLEENLAMLAEMSAVELILQLTEEKANLQSSIEVSLNYTNQFYSPV